MPTSRNDFWNGLRWFRSHAERAGKPRSRSKVAEQQLRSGAFSWRAR